MTKTAEVSSSRLMMPGVATRVRTGRAGAGSGRKRQGWYSQMLNSLSNKSAEGQTESREEIVEVHERKFSDDSV